MLTASDLELRRVDLRQAQDADALVFLLDHYAASHEGGGEPLSAYAHEHLVRRLTDWPGFVAFIAWAGTKPVGLINCFTGFSTFSAKPLLNIHDVVVHADWRGRGMGRLLLAAAEGAALDSGCCKMTLEVLTHNASARSLYTRYGFAAYELDPALGTAMFMEKKLASPL
ncbi:MAG: GNAT family N-acetyltransferase [Rhodocyclaceae bacterium]